MSKAKDAARRQAAAEVQRRRRAAAHRSLRARAARGKGARALDEVADVPTANRAVTSPPVAPTWLAASPEPVSASRQASTAPSAPSATPSAAPSPAAPTANATVDAGEATTADGDLASQVSEDSGLADTATGWTVIDATTGQIPDSTSGLHGADAADKEPPSAWPASVDDVRTEAMLSTATPTGERGSHAKKRARRWLSISTGIVVLAGVYVGAEALLSGTVPRETETLGVSIGGQSTGAAIVSVSEAAAEVESQPVTLKADDASAQMPASEAGLSIDAEATVADVTGFTLHPLRLWQHIVGAGHIDPVTTVDDEALSAAVTKAADTLDRDAVDASVTIESTTAVASAGSNAVAVDIDSTAALVAEAWPASTSIDAVAEVTAPAVSDEEAQEFAQYLTSQVFVGDVTLASDATDGREAEEAVVTAEDLAAHASVSSTDGTLTLVVDGEALAAQMVDANPDLETEPTDASISFTDSQELKVTPQVNGTTVDGSALGDAVVAAATTPGRSGDLPLMVKEPEVTDESLGVADLKEKVASFDTPLTNEPIRTQNLRTAAADVEGTVLLPNAVFDLYKTLSPITTAEGYADAHVIVDGVLTEGMGGGLSQMATTVYNAAYFTGYEITRFRPHSVWFDRYPAGRESTMYGNQINVEFTNNTPYAAVLNSYVSGGRLHVDVWSTPHFDVETKASGKSNIKQPGVKKVDSANCSPHGPGNPGFTITNTRTIRLNGEVVSTEPFTWTYAPNDAVKCVGDDEDDE